MNRSRIDSSTPATRASNHSGKKRHARTMTQPATNRNASMDSRIALSTMVIMKAGVDMANPFPV